MNEHEHKFVLADFKPLPEMTVFERATYEGIAPYAVWTCECGETKMVELTTTSDSETIL